MASPYFFIVFKFLRPRASTSAFRIHFDLHRRSPDLQDTVAIIGTEYIFIHLAPDHLVYALFKGRRILKTHR